MPDNDNTHTTTEYQARAEKAIQKRSERGEAEPVQPPKKPLKKVDVQLKLWPSAVRANPNSLVRSALFGLLERGKRGYIDGKPVAAWRGVELFYRGEQLSQADCDVWMQAVHEARERLGYKVIINERQFLRAMGRSEGGRDIQWLRETLSRLKATDVAIRTEGRWVFHESLIDKYAEDELTGRYVLHLTQEMVGLFKDGATYLDLNQRKQLASPLARWLQGYVCSHEATRRKPHRIGVEKLRELCGSKLSRLRRFRELLKRSMDELLAAGVVASWKFDPDGRVLEFVRPKQNKSKN